MLISMVFYYLTLIAMWPVLIVVCGIQAAVTVWLLRLWLYRADDMTGREARRVRLGIIGGLLFAVLVPSIWFAIRGGAEPVAFSEMPIVLRDAAVAILMYSPFAIVPAALLGLLVGVAIRLVRPNTSASPSNARQHGAMVAGVLFIPGCSLVVLNAVVYASGYRFPPSLIL